MPHLIDHDATGIVTPSTHLEDHDTLFLVSSLCTVNNYAVGYQICTFSELPYTITTDKHLADFRVLTPEQLQHIKPINPSMLTFIMHQHTEVTDVYLNELLKVNDKEDKTEQYWFPTPEQPGDPTTYTPIQKRMFDELVELQTLEKLNPQPAKHRFHRLVFDPERQKLPHFLEELQESTEKAFGDIASQMIENLFYAKMPPHLKRSINQAYLENGTYEQIVRHLEREMELNGLESLALKRK